MKHLKTYKLFESTDLDTIKDILLELEDIGFSIEILDMVKIGKSKSDPQLSTYGRFYTKDNILFNTSGTYKKYFICIKIIKNVFEWDEVEDCIKRLVDFLESHSETTYRYCQINFSNTISTCTYPNTELTDNFRDYIRNNFKKLKEVEIYFEII
jgi:hypothetical protein